MSAIKKFFEKKALEGKFKKAGQGKRLADQKVSGQTSSSSKSSKKNSQNKMTDEKKMAAMAALSRLEVKKENENKGHSSRGGMTMKGQLLAEQKEVEALARKLAASKPLKLDSSKVVSGVYFTCPTLSLTTPLPKDALILQMHQYFLSQLGEEPELTSTLMITTLNRDRKQVDACLATLQKYLSNIVLKPQEDVYRRIKATNKVLNEKVLSCKGAWEFMQAVGFERSGVVLEGVMEEYLVLNVDAQDTEGMVERLEELGELLREAEEIPLQLHRDLKVLRVGHGGVEKGMDVPDEFYRVKPEELKKEQRVREEAVKEMGMLVTKEMRERERQRGLRRYRYGVVRVRLPDDYVVQGTFMSGEVFGDVRMWVEELVEEGVVFRLARGLGGAIDEDEKSLAELDLLPASLLMLSFDPPAPSHSLKLSFRNLAHDL